MLLPLSAPGQQPSGEDILDRVDENLSAQSQIFTSRMIIHGPRGSRSLESKTWTRGEEDSYTEYLAPPREAGTKMLKLGNRLWIYSPETDRTISISGHMLRQSLMGSDLSYEDMMENPKLREKYEATLTGSATIGETACWVLELIAKTPDVNYQLRKIWVDQQKYVPVKEELYAKSGKLLKKTDFSDIRPIQGRWYPGKIHFKDMLKMGDGTEFIIEDIVFNPDIPDHIFSKASLR
jgi:outer membrane lipoprotein-sorting protein